MQTQSGPYTFTIHSALEAKDMLHAVEARQKELKEKLSCIGGGQAKRKLEYELNRQNIAQKKLEKAVHFPYYRISEF